ncbi:hypothetical protein L202_03030 [Cryptococcus amylolentus CBS 6039]|uniref:Ion transport domain-containing protein n=2 Tax=Cryptococcus amylolentus TaxID=104669 RepID=A0A1E3HX74_9TREE|nr:hypothetical protein L202_03030 [Cryptococcus amylolentus CBS 6039]ODN80904.1 hypothetical protein L202_03030 [Cryptococcus amylolentus CBS 6039]ODO09404.1 hypothetical protein I350_03004 [Cryptococcus amylolentus CBS 6273]
MAYTPTEATPLLGPQSGPSSKILSETKVYPLIHLIRVDIMAHIDAPLTYEQLLAPDSTYTIIRPLTEKYLALQNQATVFCLLLNKIQFTQDSNQLSIATLSLTRATLCEILASRVLRGWSERSLPLATVLLTPWSLFQGASEAVIERAKEEGDGDLLKQTGAALEMAIISGSKRFIRSPSCQKVIEGIWAGKIIYSALNAHALIADNYKKKPIQMYNPHKAPVLDHYRLKVPRYRSMLEYFNFLVLFILYVVAIEGLEEDKIIGREWAFIVYAMAFSLDKLAAIREHGLKVFSSSLVNGFDLVFMMIYGAYMSTRMYGLRYNDIYFMEMGADWLAIGAVLIFPRLAFVTLANNLMVLSIRSMLTEFFFLMGVGVFCFAGFVYALFTLGQGKFDLPQIGWWLLEIYFGLDASGFEHAHYFHPFLGPLLMVSYALLSNTLLLTVLVAILGNTFATINADAAAESMFRKAVSTIEGVKADAVFSYQLPFNLPAVVFMFPMRYLLNDRWFHKVNVFMIRVSSVHILLLIALYERQSYKDQTLMEQLGDFAERYVGSLPRRLKAAAGFDNFASRSDLEAVFEIEREVGSFYAGWDDDLDLDEPDILLPPAFEDAFANESPEREGAEDEDGLGERQDLFAPQSAPLTASPSRLEHQIESPRPRRNSMPSPHRAVNQAIPQQSSLRRRNSSMHGPSPLAQLFVRSPESEGLRGRRTSLAGMVATSVQPAAPSVFTPPARKRGHSRSESFPATSTGDQSRYSTSSLPRRGYARPSVAPITEGKTVSFASHLKDSEDDGVVEPGAITHDQPENMGAVGRGGVSIGNKTSGTQTQPLSGRSVRFPTVGDHQDLQSSFGTTAFDTKSQSPHPSEKVAKVSDVESLAMVKPEEEARSKGVQEKLDDMDKRQKRMEEMMERLLSKLDG